jgi:hypothetical protein
MTKHPPISTDVNNRFVLFAYVFSVDFCLMVILTCFSDPRRESCYQHLALKQVETVGLSTQICLIRAENKIVETV